MKKKIGIHWFRNDLRTIDNPSLNHLSRIYYDITVRESSYTYETTFTILFIIFRG